MQEANAARPPQAEMLDQIVAYWRSCAVHVAARMCLADHLAQGPLPPEDLAARAGAEAPALYRLLRMLASFGVFSEGPDGRFANTALSETLRSDVAGSMRGFAVMMVDDYNLDAWKSLGAGVAQGVLPFEHVHGRGPFEFLAQHPEKAREFGEAMSSISTMENAAVAEVCDLAGARKLVDVGGSHGHMLAAILERHPDLAGVLYDRPEVIENASSAPFLSAPGLASRVELEAGDFFESVPGGADAYTMKYILHDWDDARSIAILRNCARAMAPHGRVLVVDNVVPPGNDPHWGKLLDVNMLVLTGGKERTEAEFTELFEAADLRLTRVIPTACALSIVEGRRA